MHYIDELCKPPLPKAEIRDAEEDAVDAQKAAVAVQSIRDMLQADYQIFVDDAFVEYVVQMYCDGGTNVSAMTRNNMVTEVLSEAIRDADDCPIQNAIDDALCLLQKCFRSDQAKSISDVQLLGGTSSCTPSESVADHYSRPAPVLSTRPPEPPGEASVGAAQGRDSACSSGSDPSQDNPSHEDEAVLSSEFRSVFWDMYGHVDRSAAKTHADDLKLDPQVKRNVVERFAVRIQDTLEIRERDGRLGSALEESRISEHLAIASDTAAVERNSLVDYYCNDNRTRAALAVQQQRDEAKHKHAQAVAKQKMERAAEQLRKERLKQRTSKKERRCGRC